MVPQTTVLLRATVSVLLSILSILNIPYLVNVSSEEVQPVRLPHVETAQSTEHEDSFLLSSSRRSLCPVRVNLLGS